MTRASVFLASLLCTTLAFGQRTGGSFGVRAWGSRPSFSRPVTIARPSYVSRPAMRPVVRVVSYHPAPIAPRVIVVHHHHAPSWSWFSDDSSRDSIDAGMPRHPSGDGCSATPHRASFAGAPLVLAACVALNRRKFSR